MRFVAVVVVVAVVVIVVVMAVAVVANSLDALPPLISSLRFVG